MTSHLECYKLIMKLLVFTGILLLTQAKPRPKADVSLNYNYKPPATSYGVPSGSIDYNIQNVASTTQPSVLSNTLPTTTYVSSSSSPVPLGSRSSSISYETSSLSPFAFSTTPETGFQLPSREFTSFTGDVQSLANIPLENTALSSPLLSNTFLQNGNINFANAPEILYSGGQNYNLHNLGNFDVDVQPLRFGNPTVSLGIQTTLNNVDSNNAGLNLGESKEPQIEVSKHLYFYSAPEVLQVPSQRINLPDERTKQNVKILFIKAPALATPAPIVIPARKQNEEKTIVYVLVKKPEEPAPIEVNTPPTTPPSKPEVYFIKYKTQEEAEKAVASIQKEHQKQKINIDLRGRPVNNIALQENAIEQLTNQNVVHPNPSPFNQGVSVINNGQLGNGVPVFTTTFSPLTSYSSSANLGASGLKNSVQQFSPFFNFAKSEISPASRFSVSDRFSVPNNIAQQFSATRTFQTPTTFSEQNVRSETPNSVSSAEIVSSNGSGNTEVDGNYSNENNSAGNLSSASFSVPHTSYGVPNKK